MKLPDRLFILLLLPGFLYGQNIDTVNLQTVNISSFYHNRPILRLPASVTLVDSITLMHFKGHSEIAALNVYPGIRIEERSPGSYRLSIRGSLLRSPFGIRNVKIYLDDFPLTDAGGNTYLNLTDLSTISHLEILKGPDGSLYGANSGGVIRLLFESQLDTTAAISAGGAYGSYALSNHQLTINVPLRKHFLSFNEASWSYGGYRQNSEFERKYFRITDNWNYSTKGSLNFLVFISDLEYQTPGGLTYDEWQINPVSARPPTLSFPGAIQQSAGVDNRTAFYGIKHDRRINSFIRHTISFFGSAIDFQNRFITNIETRAEQNIGFRTVIEASNNRTGELHLTVNSGIEGQWSEADVINYRNNNGINDTLIASATLNANYLNVFARITADFYNKIIIETSVGYNKHDYGFSKLIPENFTASTQFKPILMPRFSISWLLNPQIAWRLSVSRGYSPPSFNEVRPSDNRINLKLQPEHGYSYETGIRSILFDTRVRWDVSLFYFPLQQSIVRKLNESGTEFFENAGKVKQTGLESQVSVDLITTRLTKLQLVQNLTLNHFIFENYYSPSGFDLTGNKIPGVPSEQLVTSAYLQWNSSIDLYLAHNYTTSFHLNDENTVLSKPSNLLYARIGYSIPIKNNTLIFYLAGDNILNTKHNQAYDINAFGGRYYNPAPGRNFTFGIMLR